MSHKVITVTYPDNTKKVIVSKQITSKPTSIDTSKPIFTREKEKEKEKEKDRRPKPGTPKISISQERNGYKNGGKIKH